MRKTWVLPLIVGGCMLVAVLFLVWSRRLATTVETTRAVPWQPVPPAGDPMPVLRPRQGLDTAMPIIQFDSAGRPHPPTSRRHGSR
jgi:hypothetical protein